MDDLFGTISETPVIATSVDPAADFLTREQAELDKIESNNPETIVAKSNENEWIVVNDSKQISNEQQAKADIYSAVHIADKHSQESYKLKQWREEQKTHQATKDAEEENKKKELKEQARKELDDWYQNRKEQLEKTHSNNKVSEKEEQQESSFAGVKNDGYEWERVAKLCDFNTKFNKGTKDVSRMRALLLQLKQQPLVR